MKLFKITGNNSKLILKLTNPIHLDDGDYSIGLSGFYSDNFIKNIPNDLDACFGFRSEKSETLYDISSGYYTVESIKERIKECLIEFKKKYKLEFNEDNFYLESVNNLISIKSPITLLIDKYLSKLLGFDGVNEDELLVINANESQVGDKLPKLRPFDVIEIHCNLVEYSHEKYDEHKHKDSEILYSFFPNVAYGSKISEKPFQIDYISTKNINKIQEIIITIEDGEGNLLNNEKINNIVYLRLKKNINQIH